jgi:cyclohexadieny/prephenate dehydrogenase
MFSQITIIGFGLIGSSFAKAVKALYPKTKIICLDTSAEVCEIVLQDQLADDATTNFAEGVANSDLIFLSTPVGVMGEVCQKISPALKSGAILIDTGSVKQAVIDQIVPHIPDTVDFIPCHPIAGTENSGPRSGFAELFVKRWFLITPLSSNKAENIQKISDLWTEIGSKVEIMDAKHHDLTLAITSHLPHLIAYTIVGTATDLGDDLRSEVIKFSASGFRDFTRIAASDPVMWRDVFLNNKEAVLEILQRFNEDLTDMQKAIRRSDGDKLFDMFSKTRAIRKHIIDAGQA